KEAGSNSRRIRQTEDRLGEREMIEPISPEELVARIRSLIGDEDAELTVLLDHGYDESVIIGTRDAYLRVAATFLNLVILADHSFFWEVSNDSEELIGSVKVLTMNEFKYGFNELSRVWSVCAYLAKSTADVEAAIREFERTKA